MKSYFKNIFLFVLLLFCSTINLAQNFEQNLQKYWYYRERLKNFVVQGDGVGCGIISNSINENSGVLTYADQTQVLGNYISMLAMEHYLLRTQNQDLSENTKELFYAIEAFNRLDKMAETYWCNSNKFGNFNFTGYQPNINNDLNGFFIRDDTPYNLLDINYNGMLMENHLGNHWAPFKDGKRKMIMDGSFTKREYLGSPAPTMGGPTEMSLDQVIEFMGGLSLTSKFVDPNLSYSQGFSDGETKFVQEVKNIANRIRAHCQGNNWTIKNPVTGSCVKATKYTTNNCLDGGAIFWDLSRGFAKAHSLLADGFSSSTGTTWQNYYNSDVRVNSTALAFWNYYQNNPHPKRYEETKVLFLAALSNIWGSSTQSTLYERSYQIYRQDFINFPHYPMIHAILFNQQCMLPNSVYECMLNSAQKYGPTVSEYNYEWNGQRLLYGPNDKHEIWSSGSGWGEYMYYFNMYCIYNSSYMNGNYRKIPPNELAELEIVKTGNVNSDYKEWDWKKFDAVNSITAGAINNYGKYIIKKYDGYQVPITSPICNKDIIGNYVPSLGSPISILGNTENIPGQFACTYDQIEQTDATKVFFKAGEIVKLLPGFEVHSGAELDAWTEKGMKEYHGSESMTCIPCSSCRVGGDEKIGLGFREKSDERLYKVYQFVPGELLVATPHVIFKIRDDGQIGENMFGIIEDFEDDLLTPADCPNEYGTSGGNNGVRILLGYQRFKDPGLANAHNIIDVDYWKGHIFVSFADGRMLRIKGTGGLGKDMFGVTDDNPGLAITKINNNATELGYYKFPHKIFTVETFDNDYMIIAFNFNLNLNIHNSEILKINNVGYTSGNVLLNNFMGLTYSSSNGYTGYSYIGKDRFRGRITCLKNINGNLYIGTKNSSLTGNIGLGQTQVGKLLKINGAGGTGASMLAINEPNLQSTFAFNPISNYNYYIGDEKFSNDYSYPTDIHYYQGDVIVALKNGKVFRASDDGTGHHMFNINEYNSSFGIHSNSSPIKLKSYQDFSSGIGGPLSNKYVLSMNNVENYLLLGLKDGKLVRVDLDYYSLNGLLGDYYSTSDFETSVVSITKVLHGNCAGGIGSGDPRDGRLANIPDDNGVSCNLCYAKVFIGFAGDHIIGVKNAGDIGDYTNFYKITWRESVNAMLMGSQEDHSGFTSQCGNYWYIGSNNFKSVCAGARMAIDSSLIEKEPPLSEDEYLSLANQPELVNVYDYSYIYSIKTSPNPNSGDFNVKIVSPEDVEFEILLTDLTGKLLANYTLKTNSELGISSGLKSGVYILKAINKSNNCTLTEKIIINQ